MYNFVYICIDAARNYPSPYSRKLGGYAGRPPIFDEFMKESIYFENAVCTAPSTIMSFSATFSGFPSGFLARNFIDFKFDHHVFDSLIKILQNNKYEIYSLIHYGYGRKFFKEMLLPIGKEFWPKGLQEDKEWKNEEVMALFENLTKMTALTTPFALVVHINVRWDREVSQKVRNIFKYLKDADAYDNSIIILCSDHGLPDPKRNISVGLARERGHDLIVTDDNILFPFCLKYPGCSPQSIKQFVSNLDIFPTVLDLLGLSYENKIGIPLEGMSLIPMINGENREIYDERMMLTECRFISQPYRTISLRGNDYKYVYYYDEDEEQFYDLHDDPEEEKNIISSELKDVQSAIQNYRRAFKKYEEELLNFHLKYLLNYFHQELQRETIKINNNDNILIFGSTDIEFTKALLTGISRKAPSANIYVVSRENLNRGSEKRLIKEEYSCNRELEEERKKIISWSSENISGEVDIVFLLMDDTTRTEIIKKMEKIVRKISSRIIYVNYNMEMSTKLKRRKIPFGSNPDIPLFIRKTYKWLGYHYYRRYWYLDDIKLFLNRLIPFLKLKTKRVD